MKNIKSLSDSHIPAIMVISTILYENVIKKSPNLFGEYKRYGQAEKNNCIIYSFVIELETSIL